MDVFITLFVVGCVFASVILHELGHLIGIGIFAKGNKPKFFFDKKGIGWEIDYTGVPLNNQAIINLCGIVLGYMPLVHMIDYLNISVFYSIAIIGIYFIGCKTDFKQIWYLHKEIKRGDRKEAIL